MVGATVFLLLGLLLAASASPAAPAGARGGGLARLRHALSEEYWRPEEEFTRMPVVGVLTLPVTITTERKYGDSHFATSYTRWVESGGARTVPIFFDASEEELDYVLNRVNGVVWTGGLVDFNPEIDDPEGSKYLRSTTYMWRHIVRENDRGNYYPLWTTCLGFERLVQLVANNRSKEFLEVVDAENFPIHLDLTTDGWLSRLFGGMEYELFKEVASPVNHGLAFNNHGLGVHPHTFQNSPASEHLRVLSIDRDRNGLEFVSTVEGRNLPVYGVQWHPEKASWEWEVQYNVSHSRFAVEFSSYLSRFFVHECKFNKNSFENNTAIARLLTSNWPTKPCGPVTGISCEFYSETTFFPTKMQYGVTLPRDYSAELSSQ